MSTIQSATWASTKVPSTSSAAQQKFSQLIHPEKAQNSKNEDGTKTVIERSVVTAADGSKVIILTSVTINADGSRGEVKPISKMKIGKNDNDCQPSVIDPEKIEKPAEKKDPSSANNDLIKNTAGNEYEQNSITGNYTTGILLQESI